MRKNLQLSAMVILILNIALQAQVPNGDFEQWVGGQPVGWWTNNYLRATVEQTSDAHKVYVLLDKVVNNLVNERQNAGNHSVIFNASELAGGVYFYRITAGKFRAVKKLILLK